MIKIELTPEELKVVMNAMLAYSNGRWHMLSAMSQKHFKGPHGEDVTPEQLRKLREGVKTIDSARAKLKEAYNGQDHV